MVGDEVTAEELNDQIGNEQVPTCIVMPTNLYRQIWEFLMALSLFQNAIYIPGKISYTTDTSWYVGTFDLAVDLMFFIDVWLTFFFALKIRGFTHTSRGYIVKYYLTGNFWGDLFLALPWQLGSEVAGYPLKIFRLLRVNDRFGKVNLFQLMNRVGLIGKKDTPSNISMKIF